MIHDAANPEDPGTWLCTPKLHNRAAPPSIHPCQGRATSLLSLPDPNMFCRRDDKIEFVLSNQIRPLVVHVRTSTPSRSANLKSKWRKRRREQIETSSRKQSNAKAICLFKADFESQFPITDLTPKDNWFALKPIRVWSRFICTKPIPKYLPNLPTFPLLTHHPVNTLYLYP